MSKILKLVKPVKSVGVAASTKKAAVKKTSVFDMVNAAPNHLDVNFDEITRLMGDSAANGDKNDPVVLTGSAELAMRQLIAHYGFDRLPLTIGELYGFMDYADKLDSASGARFCPEDELHLWRKGSFSVWKRKYPELMPAIELFCAGNLSELKALHVREHTMEKLGKAFVEFTD